jgi:hypothetical protein
MTPASRAGRAALVLDGTVCRIPSAPDVVVITFWIQFRNDTAETLLDLQTLRSSLTDEAGAALDYDEAPVTVAGRTDRITPGAGFVTVARHTLSGRRHPRLIRSSVAVRAAAARGGLVEHSAGVEVRIDRRIPPTVHFTPMIGQDDAPQRVNRAQGG